MLSPWAWFLLAALFVSSTGMALHTAALGWWVWRETASPASLALLSFAQATPLLGLPALGGAGLGWLAAAAGAPLAVAVSGAALFGGSLTLLLQVRCGRPP